MNVLSLFAGIGGLDLGLERAGMTVVGQVEIDPFCLSVLAKHWPEVPHHDDVRTAVEWWRSGRRPPIDLVCGGFPCQPTSEAGLKLGTADERWLWPEMALIIEALHPEWVVWENVPGLRTRGLDIVHSDLLRLGYRHRVGWASACAVGAPHARRRLFGISHTTGVGRSTGWPEPCHLDQATGQEPRSEAVRVAQWPDEPRMDRVAYGISRGVDRRTALGNAVVPQVAEYIGRLVMQAAEND
jgi:DNA (cytosine-5)-methyltransferase 1